MALFLGYLAAAFLAASLLVKRALWFRWINLFGCLTFVVYGVLIDAFPVILTNVTLFIINIVQLVQLYTRKEHFEFVQVRKGDEIVHRFLKFYKKDLQNYFPHFQFTDDENKICFMVLRDFTIANLFVARRTEDGKIFVEINYTVPQFRDYKVGKFIFDEGADFLGIHGVTTIYTKSYFAPHTEFLKRMGFTSAIVNGEEYFEKKLG